MKGIRCFKLIFLFIFLISTGLSSVCAEQIETKSSPNYLIILVHGINSTHRIFMGKGENGSDVSKIPEDERYPYGDLKGYLENNLGLKGYVYAYTFSERDGRIELMANELGNPNWDNKAATIGGTLNHAIMGKPINKEATGITDIVNGVRTGQGNSWFEQAREDFIQWFKTKGPGKDRVIKDPLPQEIPQKYILISHSLGGLTSRAFLSSDYYQGSPEVSALITISSQNNGSDSSQVLKKLSEFYGNNEYLKSMATMFGLVLTALAVDQEEIAKYCGVSGFLLAYGRTMGDIMVEDSLGWYPDQPGVQDIDSKGNWIRELNNKNIIKNNQPIKVRFISCDGIPTPSGDLPGNRYLFGLSGLQTIFSSGYINDLPLGAKIMAIYMSEAMGAIMNQNGDLYSNQKSQQGEGLWMLNSSNIDFKKYSIRSGDDWGALNDIFIGLSTAMAGITFFTPIKVAQIPLKFSLIMASGYIASSAMMDRVKDYVSGHGLILKWVYEQGVIDKALDGILPVGGKAQSTSISGISASSVNSPTASYSAPEQAFVLLSDLDSDKKLTGIYHGVTIEALTEGNPNSGMFFPIGFDGQKKWVSSITVKEAPTAIKGVIDTFLPKKLRQFQYSENFAAWKNIGEVDRWGNFTIKDLKLAEGQNVIAFRAESWTGNKSNQHLKIILNTIPQYVSRPIPEPDSYTANVNQLMAVEANKSNYTSDPSEAIRATSFQLDGVELLDKINIIASQETYSSHIRAEYTPQSPLSPGEHSMAVKSSPTPTMSGSPLSISWRGPEAGGI